MRQTLWRFSWFRQLFCSHLTWKPTCCPVLYPAPFSETEWICVDCGKHKVFKNESPPVNYIGSC